MQMTMSGETRAVLVRFAMVGVVKTIVDFGVFNAIVWTSTDPSTPLILVANSLGFALSVLLGYVLHASYAFRVSLRSGSLSSYIGVSIASVIFYNLALSALVASVDTSSILVLNGCKLLALAASLAANFLGYRHLVFPATAEASAAPRDSQPVA